MKKIKYLLLTSLFMFPLVVNATTVNTDFDSSTCTLKVHGEFTLDNAHDVQVSLYKKPNELKGLKNTVLDGNDYSVDFILTYDEETKIDVTVADQNGNGDTTFEDVVVPACELAYNPNKKDTLGDFDGNGHFITIKDKSVGFNEGDRLDVEMLDIDKINAILEQLKGTPDYDGFAAIKNGILEQLGEYKEFAQFMNVYVRELAGREYIDIDYSNYTKGFILRLNLPKDVYKQYPGLRAAYFDQANIKLGDVIETSYDEENEEFILNISKPGQFILYLDNDYEYIDNTANPKYTIGTDNTLTLKINADLSKFKKITIDGKEVTKFDKKSGSTIINLAADYLDSLSVGSHEVVAYFSDGTAKTTLTVDKKQEESIISKIVNPSTNDPIYIFIRLALISFVGLSVVLIKSKTSKRTN